MQLLLTLLIRDVVLALAGTTRATGAVMKVGWQVPRIANAGYVRRMTGRYNAISSPTLLAKPSDKMRYRHKKPVSLNQKQRKTARI
jgi:hypothetical protein